MVPLSYLQGSKDVSVQKDGEPWIEIEMLYFLYSAPLSTRTFSCGLYY